jgi:hypothetical protein
MGSLLFSPAPVSGEAHIGAANPAQFFAGATEITELYAGATRIWVKPTPTLVGHWTVVGQQLDLNIPAIDGYTAGTYTVQVDTPPAAFGRADYILGTQVVTGRGTIRMGTTGSTAVLFATTNPDQTITNQRAVERWGGQTIEITVNNSRQITSVRVAGTSTYEAAVRALSPRAYWPLEVDVNDVVGGYHLRGTYVHSTKGLYPGSDGAAAFNGGTLNLLDAPDHVLVAPPLGLHSPADTTVWTVCAWVSPRTASTMQGLFGNIPYSRSSASVGTWSLETTANSTFGVKYQRDSSSTAYIDSPSRSLYGTAVTFGSAPVFVVISDGNFWVNSIKATSARPTLKIEISGSSSQFAIGATEKSGSLVAANNGYLHGYSGEIAGVALFNKVLTQAQIDTLHLAGRAA